MTPATRARLQEVVNEMLKEQDCHPVMQGMGVSRRTVAEWAAILAACLAAEGEHHESRSPDGDGQGLQGPEHLRAERRHQSLAADNCRAHGAGSEPADSQPVAACLAAEGEEDMSVQVADYEIALQRAAAIILKLRGCAEDEIDDQLIASLVDHELREPPAPPVASQASPEGE
jgi:hypothetical protein